MASSPADDEPVTERDPLRRVARYRVERLRAEETRTTDAAETGEPAEPDGALDPSDAARVRMANRGAWADELIRQAMARGEFDDLAYAGRPIPGLTGTHDPDWWVKGLIEREQITGVLPEALQLRKDDAVLDDQLDAAPDADAVRALVEEFNARVVAARRQLLGGPPVVTPTRDVEAEVTRWHERRRARAEAAVAERAAADPTAAEATAHRAQGTREDDGTGRRRRRWFRRR